MFRNTKRHNVIYVISCFYSIGCRIVNWITADGCVHIAESVGSRLELPANSCTHRQRRRDATKQFRRVGVGGVYWSVGCHYFFRGPRLPPSHTAHSYTWQVSKLRCFVTEVHACDVSKWLGRSRKVVTWQQNGYRRKSSVNFRGHDIFARKICMKN